MRAITGAFLPDALCTRVVGSEDAGKACFGDVGVDLCGAEAAVAEQHLHDAQVGAVVDEVGCERMAQGVRRDGRGDAAGGSIVADKFPEGLTGYGFAAFVEEKNVVQRVFEQLRAGAMDVTFDGSHGVFADGDEAFFLPFAAYAQDAVLQVEVAEAQADEFADAQAAGVEQFEHGGVAAAGWRGGVGGSQQFFDVCFADAAR